MIYTISFNYSDEFVNGDEPHDCLICVYDTGTAEGERLQNALDKMNDTDNSEEVDKILLDLYGLRDDDICFFFDLDGVDELTLVPELQKSFDIIIHNIWEEK